MGRHKRNRPNRGSSDGPTVSLSRRELVALVPVVATGLSGCSSAEDGGDPTPTTADDPKPTERPTTFGYGGTPTAERASAEVEGPAGTTAPGTTDGGNPSEASTVTTTTQTTTTPPTQTTRTAAGGSDFGQQGYGEYGYGGSA